MIVDERRKVPTVSPGILNKGPGGGAKEGRQRGITEEEKTMAGNCGADHGVLETKIDDLTKGFETYKEAHHKEQVRPLWEELKNVRKDFKEGLLAMEARQEITNKRIEGGIKSNTRIFIGFLTALIVTIIAQTNIQKTPDGGSPWKPYWMQEAQSKTIDLDKYLMLEINKVLDQQLSIEKYKKITGQQDD